MFCLYCGRSLPLLRDLALGEFCSAEHREEFEQLEHEFQEAESAPAPARCSSLVSLHPTIAPRAANVDSGLPDLSAVSAGAGPVKEPAPCASVRMTPATAEPGYIGTLTSVMACSVPPKEVRPPSLTLQISGPHFEPKLLRLPFSLAHQAAKPAPLARGREASATPEPLMERVRLPLAGSMEEFAAAASPAQPPTESRHSGRFPIPRWRTLAFAAATVTAAVFLMTRSFPAARAAERNVNSWNQVRKNIANRAAINMVDDFRTGLDAWKSRQPNSGWSYDSVGFIRPAALAVYDPSLNLTDYSVEFLGQLRSKGLGMVVRAADLNNYYAVRLSVVRPGPFPIVQIVRYPVIAGREGRHVVKPLPLSIRPDSMFRARLQADGDEFTLMVQDEIVDLWTDARLRKGGIGFFCQRGDDARLRWVEITHHDDTLGRLCALIAPYSVTGANGSTGINE